MVPGLDPRHLPRLDFIKGEEADALEKLSKAIAAIPGIETLIAKELPKKKAAST